MVALIIIGIVALIIIIIVAQNQMSSSKITKSGLDPHSVIKIGKYITGHPSINNTQLVLIDPCENEFKIYSDESENIGGNINFLGSIPCKNIKNIKIEDATTMEKRVTLTRMVAFGLFAFALKKNEKKEVAYLSIEWNDGRFDHETIFESSFLSLLNTHRNSLIRACQNQNL